MKYLKVSWFFILGISLAATPTVNVTECSLVFRYKTVYYSGCTDMDSEGTPWCLLKKPIDGNPWGYCNLDTLPTYYTISNNEECDQSSSVKAASSAYGCYSIKDQNSYVCMSNGQEMPCVLPSSGKNNESSKSSSSKLPSTSDVARDAFSLQIILILSMVCGLSVILSVILVAVRRARRTAPYIEPKPITPAIRVDQISTPDLSKYGTISSLQPAAINDFKEYTIISTYTPTLSDELLLRPGDRVVVYKSYDDGWVQGANLSRGGTKGVFPRHCFEPISNNIEEDTSKSKRTSSIYTTNDNLI